MTTPSSLDTHLYIVRVTETGFGDCAESKLKPKEIIMWTKPQATEMRFGFEVTMYVCNR
jgi:pyrroloquinoline quinone biosynthesis protein A